MDNVSGVSVLRLIESILNFLSIVNWFSKCLVIVSLSLQDRSHWRFLFICFWNYLWVSEQSNFYLYTHKYINYMFFLLELCLTISACISLSFFFSITLLISCFFFICLFLFYLLFFSFLFIIDFSLSLAFVKNFLSFYWEFK